MTRDGLVDALLKLTEGHDDAMEALTCVLAMHIALTMPSPATAATVAECTAVDLIKFVAQTMEMRIKEAERRGEVVGLDTVGDVFCGKVRE